jgi:tetratricopeptide (TPR) repeat protein
MVKSAVGLGPGKAAAEKAIALDPHLDQAYAALGLLKFADWDLPGAAMEYRQALQLNPSFAIVHNRLAIISFAQGKFPDAERELLEAQSLDPFNIAHPATLGELYYYWRRYEQAIRVCNQMLATNARSVPAMELLARIRLGQARRQYELMFSDQLLNVEPSDPLHRVYYAAAVNPAEGLHVLKGWLRTPEGATIPAAVSALYYMRVGDKESCLRLLRQAVDERDPDLISLKWDPIFDPIRDDERYKAIEQILTSKFGG